MAAMVVDPSEAMTLVETPQQVALADSPVSTSSDQTDFVDGGPGEFRFADSLGDAEQRQREQIEQEVRLELVFIDAGAEDYLRLVGDLQAGDDPTRELEVYLLDAHRDGIDQISQVLSGYNDLDAVHLVSHGAAGKVKLGDVWLDIDSLDGHAGQIAGWNSAHS